jgi:hypothetical protein
MNKDFLKQREKELGDRVRYEKNKRLAVITQNNQSGYAVACVDREDTKKISFIAYAMTLNDAFDELEEYLNDEQAE